MKLSPTAAQFLSKYADYIRTTDDHSRLDPVLASQWFALTTEERAAICKVNGEAIKEWIARNL